jgi:Zn-dependent protease
LGISQAQLIVLSVIPAILAITVHEVMHGYAALRFGDSTAKRMGRLTLNPIKHVDIVGTILIPALLIITNAGFIFGWAKPVPVNFYMLRNPKRDMVYVAAAGPGANFLMMVAWGIILRLSLLISPWHAPLAGAGGEVIFPLQIMCVLGVLYNIVLAMFNLIPIPPLDGGRIVVGLLPDEQAKAFAQLERYGFIIVIAIVMLFPGFITTIIRPVLHLASILFGIPPIF